MTSLHIDPPLRAVQNAYPFPIAFTLQTAVFEATTAQERVEGLVRLVNTTLQYAALVVASNYAIAPFKEATTSYRLERLKRPLLSDFAHFLRVGVSALHEQGLLFIPELVTVLKETQRDRARALRMGEQGWEEREMSLLEALLSLRNALAHDRFRGTWDAFVTHHTPLVSRFLHLMRWCARYPLLRVVDAEHWVRLMGAHPAFVAEPIPDSARETLSCVQDSGEHTGLFLADPLSSRLLPLYPFILWADCPYCAQDPLLGLHEEVFLFNGDEGRRYIAYIGVRHPRPLSHPKAHIEQLYLDKSLPSPPLAVSHLSYGTLADRAGQQSDTWLQQNIAARRYLPPVYAPRQEMEAALTRFLRGRKGGFLLLGEAGIGKTNLLCHQVEEWTRQGEIVFCYAGHQLATDTGLEEQIMRDLHLTGDFLELLPFLHREGRRLILVVDGVNEHENAPALLKHLCTFISRYTPREQGEAQGALKVILSFRSSSFQKALQVLLAGGGEEASLFPASVFQTRIVEKQGQPVETSRFILERMKTEEMEAVYEGYRTYRGRLDQAGDRVRFAPRTPFSHLSPTVRIVLTHPWYLRMVMEAYDGEVIPQALWTGEILQAFCAGKIYGRTPEEEARFAGRVELVEELVTLLRHQKTDTFYRDALHDLSSRWSRFLLEHEVMRSPYLQLVDEGVLMEVAETETVGRRARTRYRIRFAFDPLLEYLLSEAILQEGGGWTALTGTYLASLLAEGITFDHLTRAVEFLLIETAQRLQRSEEGFLLAATLNAAPEESAVPVFVRVLLALAEVRHPNFGPVLELLAAHGEPGRVVAVCLNASRSSGEKQQLQAMLACTEQAERLLRQGGKAHGYPERQADLAVALLNKGVALRRLGRLEEALASQKEAIALYQHLIEEGHTPLRTRMAAVLMNMGNTLQGMGSLQRALTCYDQALQIRQEMGTAHPYDLAAIQVNKGAVLQELGRLEEAVSCYNQAIELYRTRLAGEDAPELMNELATALMNKGVALQELGRLNEAMASHDRALQIRRHLVAEMGYTALSHDLAAVLSSKGNTLQKAGQLREAMTCYEEAHRLYRALIEEGGRGELTPDLANVLMNQGNGLQRMGQLAEAIGYHDEAVSLYRRLVETGHPALAVGLARALMNQGITRHRLGRFKEAVESYDAAIQVYRQRVSDEDSPDLVNSLAAALMHKGVALQELDRPGEAIPCYEEAIRLRRYLVEEVGSPEMDHDLAMALMNQGSAYVQQERWEEALHRYNEGIALWEGLVESGMTHLLPDLLKGLGVRCALWRRYREWEAAARDVHHALHHVLQIDSPSQTLGQEFVRFLSRVRNFSAEERVHLYAALGERAELVQELLEGEEHA